MQDTRPDLAEEFIALIQNPGSAAHQAILDFSAAVISWLRPQQHTLTGLLLAGITYNRHTHAAAEAKDLVKIAVRSSDVEINIAAISRTGHYTRPGDCVGQETLQTMQDSRNLTLLLTLGGGAGLK